MEPVAKRFRCLDSEDGDKPSRGPARYERMLLKREEVLAPVSDTMRVVCRVDGPWEGPCRLATISAQSSWSQQNILNTYTTYYRSNLQPRQLFAVADIGHTKSILASLAREFSLEILQELHGRNWSTASEVARNLGIHIATAMRKLAELVAMGLVTDRTRNGSELTEYGLASARIEIVIDLDSVAKNASKTAGDAARHTLVRERPNRNVLAEADEERRVVQRLSFVRGLRWRTVVRTLELTEDEGRFLFRLPFASEPPRYVATIAKEAGVEGGPRIAKLLEFIEEAERLGVIEVVR